jgi:hypothetical protein
MSIEVSILKRLFRRNHDYPSFFPESILHFEQKLKASVELQNSTAN